MTNTPPQYPYASAPQPLNPSDEKLWATLLHIGGILFGFIAPLIGYLVLKDRGPFVAAHSKAALNFQLTLLIAWFAAYVIAIFTLGIGFMVIFVPAILGVIFPILAAVAANSGQYYKYPLTIEFLR